MTPEEKDAILAANKAGLDSYIQDGYLELLSLIRKGVDAREAIKQVIEAFPRDYAAILAPAFSAILGSAMGSAAVLEMRVSGVSLSDRIYQQSREVSAVVAGIINDHLRGFQQARELALKIYEGYDYNPKEPLTPRSTVLPRYLRKLLQNPILQNDINFLYAKIQSSELKTPALKAAYLGMLDKMQNEGSGMRALEKSLDVAYYEKMRYFANRIAQTELHRAWVDQQVSEILDEPDIEFVEWRLSGSHSGDCICVLFACQNKYGLGPGVYPKRLAPKPGAHPFCRCALVPRIDIAIGAKFRERKSADRAYLNSLTDSEAARVMGSRAKLKSVLDGHDAVNVYNKMVDPDYRVVLTGEEK